MPARSRPACLCTPFRTATVACNGFTLHQEGFDGAFRNQVDVVPLQFPEDSVDLTNEASCYTDFQLTTFRLAFVGGVAKAWGTDINQTPTLEGLLIDVVLSNNTVATTLQPPDSGFIGFVTTGSEPITSLVFRSATSQAVGGEGFSIDNVAMVLVPEPATPAIALTAVGALILSCRRGRELAARWAAPPKWH